MPPPAVSAPSKTTSKVTSSGSSKPKANKSTSKEVVQSITSAVENITLDPSVSAAATSAAESQPDSLSSVEVATKRLKALKKKLREIEEISKKNEADLTEDQKQKLQRKSAIEAEISELELEVTSGK